MAIHNEKIGLLKESLIEMLHVAEYTVTYRKTDRVKWADNTTGGILGFPAVVILFSIIDCLGSVFAGDNKFTVSIDGKNKPIRNASQHIYILNSNYFNLDLSQFRPEQHLQECQKQADTQLINARRLYSPNWRRGESSVQCGNQRDQRKNLLHKRN